MFIDEVNIKLIAGKGGDGCTSFRREKYVPMGGPDGGNGGRGGNIIFVVDKGLKTLIDLRYAKMIKADKGTNGKGSNKHGANASDLIIKVPEGTTIYDSKTGLIICDLVNTTEEFLIAHGGRGGRGNKAFATMEEPAPKFSEYGEPGEVLEIHCELKVIADVGLVGMPSVGKSSILKALSGAEPKIGAYHFTTLSPNLGVVVLDDNNRFILADLPGLIENASTGEGLGIKFLRHAMRCKIIAHVIDMGSSEGRDPLNDYEIIRGELDKYSNKLKTKKEIIIANKMDLENALDNLERFKNKYQDLTIYPVSTVDNSGYQDLIKGLNEIVKNEKPQAIYDENDYLSHAIYKFENVVPFTIRKDDQGVFIVEGKEIERLFMMTKFTEDEAVLRFGRKLKGMGVDEELYKLGARPGDTIQIMDYMFQFKDDNNTNDLD